MLDVGFVGRALCPTAWENLPGINPDLPAERVTLFREAEQAPFSGQTSSLSALLQHVVVGHRNAAEQGADDAEKSLVGAAQV